MHQFRWSRQQLKAGDLGFEIIWNWTNLINCNYDRIWHIYSQQSNEKRNEFFFEFYGFNRKEKKRNDTKKETTEQTMPQTFGASK